MYDKEIGRNSVKSLRTILSCVGTVLAAALIISGQPTRATTFTIVNDCNTTIYPAIYPADFDNGGWVQAAQTSVTFTVPTTYDGRVWARANCNSSSPALCDSGQCGGTGYQCANTTGQPTTALAEFNLDAAGTDWYDVSNVDSYNFGIGLVMSAADGYEPTCTADPLTQCPTKLQTVGTVSGVISSCANPCSVFDDSSCCNGIAAQPSRASVHTCQ